MRTRYVVWLRDKESNWQWEQQGDGPMGLKTAERVAREIRQDFGTSTRVFPEGYVPYNRERRD